MLEGLDSLLVFVAIGAVIVLWQMFTDSTASKAPRYNYHPEDFYGD